MGFLILLGAADLFFLGGMALVYVFVVRRRAKVYALIEHLASLTRKAYPLATGLRMLAADLGGIFGVRLGRVARRMEEGASLGEALRRVPSAFPPVVRSLVVLGERSGNLAAFLEELRRVYGRFVESPARSVYVFLYPVLLTVFISAVLSGLFVAIVPKFNEIFFQMGIRNLYAPWWERLLWANQAVLALSVLLLAVVFSGGASFHFGASPFRAFGAVLDRLVLWLPLVGGVVRDASVAQLARCAGLFLRGGVPMPAALRAAAEAEPNRVLAARYRRIADRAEEGVRLSTALRESGAFRPDLAWFVETGEASGELPDHLLQAAVHYDTRTRFAAQVASRAVIPFFVVLNGALVLGVCLLMFLPLRDLMRKVIPAW